MNQIKIEMSALRSVARGGCQNVLEFVVGSRKFAWLIAAMISLFGFAFSAQAQMIQIKVPQVRVTVPFNYVGSYILTSNHIAFLTNGLSQLDDTGTNWVTTPPISFNVTGLPLGASASITDSNGVPVSSISHTVSTNSGGWSTNVYLNLSLNDVAEGVYTFSVNATGGVTNNILLVLQVGDVWNGSLNTSGNWSSSGSWVGGVVPGASDDVVFSDLGAQTNAQIVTGAGGFTNAFSFTNSIVDQNMTIASLRFSQTNSSTNTDTIFINPGKTLAITGTNGFGFLRDYIDTMAIPAISSTMTVNIIGVGAQMIVSNENANIAMLIDGQLANTLNMSNLDTFVSDVNRAGFGDCSVYPNFRNYNDQNGYNGLPSKFIPTIYLAKTSTIKAVYVDPNNYTNSDDRHYALSFCRSEISGTTTAPVFDLGMTNEFYADGINFVGANQSGTVQFNPAFAGIVTNIVGSVTNYTTNVLYALFRNTNGGRMSTFCLSDDGSTNTLNSNVKGHVYFGSYGGYVDMLVDRFYISRDGQKISASGTPNIQGDLSMGQGIIDANTAILGYQETASHTNTDVDFLGYCQGTLTVSNTATFKVNDTLTLGYETETNINAEPYDNHGVVNIGPGGTVIANTITVGGPTKLSTGNNIIMTNGATLIVSNTIADSSMGLSELQLGGNSTLELFIDGNHSGPYVYVTNLVTTTVAGPNTIVIGAITNVTYTSGQAQIPLISYESGLNPTIPTVIMPAGFFGSIVVVNDDEWDLVVTTNSASSKNLLWRAPGSSANWDTTTLNWLDQNTSLMTNFSTGDQVTFDDTSGYATNVVISSTVIPSTITVTNTTLHYIFTGSGLEGSATINKTGTGILEIDGNAPVAVSVVQGLLTNDASGTIGGVSVSTGATLFNSGAIDGGVNCAGVATILSSGSVNGGLTVFDGGVVTNMGNFNAFGSLSLQSGSFLYNSPVGILDNFAGTVATNATLLNDGYLGYSAAYANTLTVSGTLEDRSGENGMTLNLLTMSAGGLFIPGGDGIGTSYVYRQLGGNFPGEVFYNTGSTNVFKVDPDDSQNTMVLANYQSFGASSSQQTQTGGTILITNVGSTPFAAGQSFQLFGNLAGGNIANTGTSTNTFPVISPATPGPGLAWDLSHLWVPNGSGNQGIIGIMNASAVPSLTSQFTVAGTNMLVQLSWPSTNAGWRLETQSEPLTIGLLSGSTNWTGVAGSWTNITMMLTNNLSTGSNAIFYRLVYP